MLLIFIGLIAMAMFIVSFLLGLNSQLLSKNIQLSSTMSVFGAGLLLGTVLMIVLPESVRSVIAASQSAN